MEGAVNKSGKRPTCLYIEVGSQEAMLRLGRYNGAHGVLGLLVKVHVNRFFLSIVLDGFASDTMQVIHAWLLAGFERVQGTKCAWLGQADVLPLVVPCADAPLPSPPFGGGVNAALNQTLVFLRMPSDRGTPT